MSGRLLGGAAATAVIGGTLFMGGIASFVVASAHHITSTTPITTGSVVGSAVLKDSATLGATTTDRHVKFFLWAPGSVNCTGTPVLTDVEPVTTAQGNGSVPVITSQSYTATVVGTYQWTAEIIAPGGAVEWPTTGTPNQCGLEPATITAAAPAIATTPTHGGPVGTVIGDTATVTGGFQPTGSVAFKLYAPSQPTCAGTPVSSSTGALTSGKATSGTYATTAVGTYRWIASYSGDSNNRPAVSGCTAEQVVVTQAAPAITTTPSKGGVIGTSISDSATVSGGVAPTGSVTFNLYGPTALTCAGTPLFTSTVALTKPTVGSGTFSGTSKVGTYSWTAAYSGDANNAAASSPCTAETVVITSPPSTPTPTPTPTSTPGGVLAITTPSTGSSGSALMLTVGGFMFLGGAGVALLGVAAPRRRRNILL